MNEKHIELFTPVSEGLPDHSDWIPVVFIFDKKPNLGLAMLDSWGTNGTRFWNIRGKFIGEEPIVTHHLDYSKLTTIEKAKEASENSIKEIKKYVISLNTPENEIYQQNELLIMSCFSQSIEIIENNLKTL